MKKQLLLLIEDNPLLTAVYENAFEKAGFDVIFAHDGEAGLALAKEKKPIAIILDIMMPGMNGSEVLEKLNKEDLTKKIKVVVLTIGIKEEDSEKAKKLGASDFLIKPDLTLDEIVSRTIKAIEK